ncbi:MAG: polysaccharide biosynthesis tyrosine autokinase, partial [Pseudomonadota bacterium]
MNRIDYSDPVRFPDQKVPFVPEPAVDRGLDVRDIFQIVWGARWMLAIFGLLGAIVAYALVKQITPQYRSTASIMLDTRQTSVIDIESVLSDVPLNRQMLESELLIIESDTLLERVVDKLRLDRDPEYNPRLAEPSATSLVIDRKKAEVKEFITGLMSEVMPASQATTPPAETAAPAPSATPVSPEAQAEADRRRAVRILRGKLKARQLSPAFAISVQVTSADPMRAALIANTVADQYVVDQLEAKFDAARRATTWLSGRVEELRIRLETSETKVQAYKNRFRTGDSQGASITRQQIAELNSDLINGKAELAEARAKFNQAREMVRSLGPAGAATALTSPLIQSLRQKRSELTRREAELSNRYGPKHPTMIELRTELGDTDAAIAVEVRQIVSSLQNDVQVAQARVATLDAELTALEAREVGESEAAVGLRQLEAEAEANRRIYNDFLQRLNETREQEEFQTADSRVIEPATPAFAPFVPRTKVSTALGGVAGLAFGLGLVVLFRLLNRTFRTVAQVTEHTGLSVYASIPKASRRQASRILSYLKRKPNSDLAESVRYLRNAILLGDGGKIRSVLVTSSFPEEGKSTLSILLAEMLGRMGKSAVLVDCDLRRPSLAPALRIKPRHDLMTLLDSAEPLEDVVVTPEDGSFDFIPLRTGRAASVDVLASPAFAEFISTLEERYDVVLIDGPPVLGVSDFSVLGKLVDTSVVVVQWDKTPVASLKRTLTWLADHRMDVLGAVLSKVDRKREAQYDNAT